MSWLFGGQESLSIKSGKWAACNMMQATAESFLQHVQALHLVGKYTVGSMKCKRPLPSVKQNDVIVTSLLSLYFVKWYSVVFSTCKKGFWPIKYTQYTAAFHLEITSFETKLVLFLHAAMNLYKIYAFCVKLRPHLKLLCRFKDTAVFVVGSFILPHPVVTMED